MHLALFNPWAEGRVQCSSIITLAVQLAHLQNGRPQGVVNEDPHHDLRLQHSIPQCQPAARPPLTAHASACIYMFVRKLWLFTTQLPPSTSPARLHSQVLLEINERSFLDLNERSFLALLSSSAQ